MSTKISYSQVEQYANEIYSIANNMNDTIENIKSKAALLPGGYWEGDAADYYTEKIGELLAAFDDIYVEMLNSYLFLAKVSDGYQALDKQIMQEICGSLQISSPNQFKSNIF